MSTVGNNQDTLVPYWALTKATSTTSGSPSLTPEEEVAFTPDYRTPVPAADYGKGGKYYSVVKLFIQYEEQSTGSTDYAMGTGWMISSDVLVTAGHCAYNWDGYGRAKTIKVYAGYCGGRFNEYSAGATVTTTAGWLAGSKNKTRDVSFVRLENAFKNISKPFNYVSTPLQGNEDLFIVGYPADKTCTDKNNKPERGGQMYESKGTIEWNLADTEYMLSYRLSTSGGNSGSPVLLDDLTSSIATHVLGSNLINSGTTIGTYGNWYLPYVQALQTPEKFQVIKTSSSGAIIYVSVPTSAKPESVLQAFAKVGSVGAKILPGVLKFGIPFLGPVGGPLAALAGTILGWAGSLCESSFDPEDECSADPSQENYAERAVLAETALQTALKLTLSQLSDLELLDAITEQYPGLQTNFGRVSPKLLGILLEPSTRIALDSILVKERVATASSESDQRVEISVSGDDTEAEGPIDDQTEAFLDKLIVPTLLCAGEESFIDDLGTLISKALKIALPIIKTAASGLAALNNTTSTEAAIVESEKDQSLSLLAKRALLGEAVLQAFMKVDAEKLEETYISNSDGTQEAFFDFFKHVAQRIGRQVLDSAPQVIDLATPIIKELLKGQQASAASGSSNKVAMRKDYRKDYKDKAPVARADPVPKIDAFADAVENEILGLQGLQPGSGHPRLNMALEDIINEVGEGNLDGTRWINRED